jgi:AI-2 transport protein TqsA
MDLTAMTKSLEADNISRTCLVILATVAVGGALIWSADILTPPAMALFLAIVIDGFARVLKRRLPRLDARVAMAVAILLPLLLFGAALFVVADNATTIATKLISYTPRLDDLLAKIAATAHMQSAPTLDELLTRLNPSKYLGGVAKGFQTFASNAVLILIYLGFILASHRGFERKMTNLSKSQTERREVFAAFESIRIGVEQYLWVQTVTGLMIAAGSWIAMRLLGLDNALFWAFLIFIAAYIPIIGGAVGILAPSIFALVQFAALDHAIILITILMSLHFITGNVILPRMQGDSLNIDPVVVLLSLAFWGAIWGVAGMFLSTPLTVIVMVVSAQFESSRWLAVLLSANGSPDKLADPASLTPDITQA